MPSWTATAQTKALVEIGKALSKCGKRGGAVQRLARDLEVATELAATVRPPLAQAGTEMGSMERARSIAAQKLLELERIDGIPEASKAGDHLAEAMKQMRALVNSLHEAQFELALTSRPADWTGRATKILETGEEVRIMYRSGQPVWLQIQSPDKKRLAAGALDPAGKPTGRWLVENGELSVSIAVQMRAGTATGPFNGYLDHQPFSGVLEAGLVKPGSLSFSPSP